MKWRQIIPCDVARNDGVECQEERGHVGLHVATEWCDGEIVGPLWWDAAGQPVEVTGWGEPS